MAVTNRLELGKMGVVVAAGLAMASTGTAALASAQAALPEQDLPGAAEQSASTGHTIQSNQVHHVTGTFAYSQDTVTPNAQIKTAFADASKYLCGSQYSSAAAQGELSNPLDWTLSVSGDVQTPFEATISEMASEGGSIHTIMGCTCLGNPADGRASINAGVEGISLSYLMEKASVADSANTVVFTSSDGYEVALPLSYVKYRFSVVAYQINEESFSEVLGCTNQLWLGSTPANNFARDIVAIDFQTRQTPPPAPFTEGYDNTSTNLPNAAIEAVS